MPFLGYLLGAASAGVAGGLLASIWAPNRWVTSYIQHFAAGVVIAAVALEVTPEIERLGASPWLVLGGFAFGGLAMVGLKWFTLHMEGRQEHPERSTPWGLTTAAAVDTAIDGLIIGAGFALREGVGVILTLALGLELLFLTMSVGASFRHQRKQRWLTVVVTSAISLLLLAGAVVGVHVLGAASKSTMAAALSFGAAALLYLVTEELLVETQLPKETLLSTTVFFLGFLAIFAFVAFGLGQ